VKRALPWLVVFVCCYVFTLFVDLGGNFFGIPDTVLPFLFAANLTLFLYLLARFVGQPIGTALEARKQGIGEELEQARHKLDEARSLRDEVRQRLTEVEREVQGLRERAESDGRLEVEEIAQQTARDEERFLKRVDEEIARRQAEARDKLAKDTAALTAELTRELLQRELTDDDRQRLLERSLSALRNTADGGE
jgi:ATP synthase F0 subunit b